MALIDLVKKKIIEYCVATKKELWENDRIDDELLIHVYKKIDAYQHRKLIQCDENKNSNFILLKLPVAVKETMDFILANKYKMGIHEETKMADHLMIKHNS